MAPTLGYWSLRGFGEPIRHLLHYTGTEFEDKMYNMKGTAQACDRTEWTNVKEKIGLEFPNLPYYMDGNVKITETQAIMRYIGRKNNLVGSSEADTIRIDVTFGVLSDCWGVFARACYSPNFEQAKPELLASYPALLKKMANMVGSNDYVLGNKICVVDFLLFELLERYLALQPTCLAGFPHLTAFVKRMTSLPQVQKYRATASFQKMKTRFNGRTAHFGHGNASY